MPRYSKRERANRRAEREWRRVKEELRGDHPYWFKYID